jgi:branched-chain amino acid transport system substrate-binding protein
LKERGPFKTVLGDLAFDEKGDPKFPGYVIYEWKKGPDGKIASSNKFLPESNCEMPGS